VKINIPHMLIGLRELQHERDAGKGHTGRRSTWKERLAYRLAREVLTRPWLYRLMLRCARFFLHFGAKDGWLRRMPGAAAGWTQARDFPAPAARSFRERWPELARRASEASS